MTSYRRGDVVLVPFDFTDRSGTKWRPAVIISSDRYNLYFSLTRGLLVVAVNVGESGIASDDAKNGLCLLAEATLFGVLRGTPSAARVRERRGDGGQNVGDISAISRVFAIVPLPDYHASGSKVSQVSEK